MAMGSEIVMYPNGNSFRKSRVGGYNWLKVLRKYMNYSEISNLLKYSGIC